MKPEDAWMADTLVNRDLLMLTPYSLLKLEDRIVVRTDRIQQDPERQQYSSCQQGSIRQPTSPASRTPTITSKTLSADRTPSANRTPVAKTQIERRSAGRLVPRRGSGVHDALQSIPFGVFQLPTSRWRNRRKPGLSRYQIR